MAKPNEVLIRLHTIRPPAALGIAVNVRDDNYLKDQHQRLGILPGKKVFETRRPGDRPWRLDNLLPELKQAGYSLDHINVELRPGASPGSQQAVLTLNFGLTGAVVCTADQAAWVEDYLGHAAFKLAMAWRNPRRDGTSQLAVDCCGAVKLEPGLRYLPVRSLLGAPVASTHQPSPA